jgi:hypothetical protein
MPDEADVGNFYAEQAILAAEEDIRWKANKLEVESKGTCLSCEADLPDGIRWCNADCRDDYFKYVKRG